MHNQPYVGRIALCTRKKLLKLKSGEIRHFYGNQEKYQISYENYSVITYREPELEN